MSFLSSLTSDIFGSQPSVQSSQQSDMNPQQLALLQQLLSGLNTGGTSATTAPYTGQLTAAANPVQGTSLAAMEQAALTAAQPGGTNAASATALTGVMNQKPQDITSYIQKAIVDPTMQAFNQQIMPAIDQRFAGQSGFGSDKAIQEGIAAGNAATGIGSAASTAAMNALQNQQQNTISAAESLTSTNTANTNQAISLNTAGNAAQTAAQAPLTTQYNAYLNTQQQQQQNIQNILSALGLQSFTNVNTVVPGQSGLLQGLAGNAGIGSAVASLL